MSRAIFIDLDGTIIDSWPGISRSVRHVFNTLSLSAPEDDDLKEFIGPPLRTSFARYFPAADEVERAVTIYREFYAREGVLDVVLYDGIVDLLSDLSRHSTLFLCTSKPAVYATEIIFHLKLQGFFKQAYAPELSGHMDCKDDLLAFALHQEKVSPTDAWMIGDRSTDINAAKSNGLRAVGVEYGYGSREELLSAGADHVVKDVSELRGLFG